MKNRAFDHKHYPDWRDPKTLIPYEKNAKIHDEKQRGSGSTLIACEQLGRKCYMAELDPRYCDVIVERWESFTGGKAVLLNG